jgi:hypothetical protein
MKLGAGLVLHPEVGLSTVVPLFGAPQQPGFGSVVVPVTLSAGLSFGGSFDMFSEPPASRAPCSPADVAARVDDGADPRFVIDVRP